MAEAAWSVPSPPLLRARTQKGKGSQLKSFFSPLQAQSPSPATSPASVRGLFWPSGESLPALLPTVQSSCLPEGCGTSGLGSLGGSSWPWAGNGCLLAPPGPMGQSAVEWGCDERGLITLEVLSS